MPDIQLSCAASARPFTVTEWEQEHLKKFDAPLPTLCPEERHRRRLSHRNERRIYKDVCDLTGKPIISIYSPDKSFTVYSQDAWWGDGWDGKDYGRDYDFNRPFFEQFAELQKVVPQLSLMNTKGENSEFCNITMSNKNCYLVFGGDYCEDALYSVFSMRCRDVSDVYWVSTSELAYDCMDCENGYNIRYCQKSAGCRDSSFLFGCRNCESCFGCVGLVSKRNHIFNKPYSSEDYAKKIKDYRLDTWSGVQRMKVEFDRFKLDFPHRFAYITGSENCTGNDIFNGENCINSFGISGPAEDLKDVFLAGWDMKDALSSDHVGYGAQLYYEMLGSVEGTHCAWCTFSWTCHETFYCEMVINSNHLFGCSNLKRAEYCILNKQYTKAEYEELVPRIIAHMKSTGEWGQFFPMERSKFAYNETVARDYFPLSKEEVLKRGLKWLDEEIHTISPNNVPDSIHDVTDSIVQNSLVCQKTGRPYKIIPSELKFYRQMEIPIPEYAPETRNEIRLQMRNPLRLWDRKCAKCLKTIQTSYAPDRPETVYCEACYLATVY